MAAVVVDLTADTPPEEDVCVVDDDELAAIDAAMQAADSYWSRHESPQTQCKAAERGKDVKAEEDAEAAAAVQRGRDCEHQQAHASCSQPPKRPGGDHMGDRSRKVAKARSVLASSKADSSFLERIERLRAGQGAGNGIATSVSDTRSDRLDVGVRAQKSQHEGARDATSGDGRLDPQQSAVLDSVLQGDNVFFSGMGGTGKTFLLKRIVAALKKAYGDKAVASCAPTGVAAILCGGQTLHSLAGCGIANTARDFEKLWKDANKKKWRLLRALVVDEVSMIDPSFLDFLDLQVRQVRANLARPFGGLQLVLCGDFCQVRARAHTHTQLHIQTRTPVPNICAYHPYFQCYVCVYHPPVPVLHIRAYILPFFSALLVYIFSVCICSHIAAFTGTAYVYMSRMLWCMRRRM